MNDTTQFATAARRSPITQVELSVVVPFYNPGAALRITIERLHKCLLAEGGSFEIIAVSDGSTDGSEASVAGIPGVRVIVSETNHGKGAALHRGFAAARGEWVAFIDADGDIDPQHVVNYLHIARVGGHAGVYADKRHHRSTSGATGLRKTISVTYSTMVTMLFVLGIRDTQTGCKVLHRDVLTTLLPRLQERRFAFDLELFVAANAAGIRDFIGAPVHLNVRTAGSTVTTRSILRTVRDTVTIWARHLDGHYQHGESAAV